MLDSARFLVLLLFALGCLIVIIPRVERQARTSFNSKPIRARVRCPSGHILTVNVGGQLGNRIWEYMSVLAIYRLHQKEVDFDVYLPYHIASPIEILFGRILAFPTIHYVPRHCRNVKVYFLGRSEAFDKTKFNNTNDALLLELYSARYKDIVEYGVDKMRRELRFRDVHRNYCNQALHRIKKRYNVDHGNVTFVGIHHRGTDYVKNLELHYHNLTKLVNATYYLKAMNYFAEKYQNVIFLLMSTDTRWLKANLPLLLHHNVIVNYNHRDTTKDLVMLSMCNHSIISYGTYGSTAAFFAGGTTFVHNLGIPVDTSGYTLALGLAQVLPNWHVL